MTGSKRLAEARPVRSPPNSLRSTSSAPSIRRRRSFKSSPCARACASLDVRFRWLCAVLDDRVTALALHHFAKPAVLEDREDQDRDAVLARQRDRRSVHHLQVALQHLAVVKPLEAPRRRYRERVGVIHTVDLGRLEE